MELIDGQPPVDDTKIDHEDRNDEIDSGDMDIETLFQE